MAPGNRSVLPLTVLVRNESRARPKLRRTFEAVFFTGEGTIDHACGECGHVIVRGLSRSQLSGMSFECPACGTLNG
jgi:predicted RNA-binding Zn-ribbon protein involved in translation (DUF1610 family)